MTATKSRDTPVTFSRQDTAHIHELMVTPGAPLLCPRCGDALEMGEPLAGGHSVMTIWEVKCASCLRSAVIRDLPERVSGSRQPHRSAEDQWKAE